MLIASVLCLEPWHALLWLVSVSVSRQRLRLGTCEDVVQAGLILQAGAGATNDLGGERQALLGQSARGRTGDR